MKAVYDVVIAGSGVCGLAVARNVRKLLGQSAKICIVSSHSPMAYTSSLSTECFRDHWPNVYMRDFMKRSIQLMEEYSLETNNAFNFNKAGYLYLSTASDSFKSFNEESINCHGQIGSRRVTEVSQLETSPNLGADVFTKKPLLETFNWLSDKTESALFARNAGWINAHSMGMTMFDSLSSDTENFTYINGDVIGIDTGKNLDSIQKIIASNKSKGLIELSSNIFVNATGPFLNSTHLLQFSTASKDALRLPVFSEVHSKVIFRDVLGVIPRNAPMTISNDDLVPKFSADELDFINDHYGQVTAERLAKPLGSGAHFRPYGGSKSNAVLMLWEAWHHGIAPSDPPPESCDQYLDHDLYPDVCVRGLANIVPGLQVYFDEEFKQKWMKHSSTNDEMFIKPVVDGGYYTKTKENLPLIGPAPGIDGLGFVKGSYICGAVSGYGIMASLAAGELCSQHINSSSLPVYAPTFSPLRYQDSEFMKQGGTLDKILRSGGGQL
jgi:sarcosine oxidase, subunit beta